MCFFRRGCGRSILIQTASIRIVLFPAWVWAQNPDPDGQHPERSIRPDCWMGLGVRLRWAAWVKPI
jgi:hypothetical protein